MADGPSRRSAFPGLAPADWATFDRAVQLGFDRMRLVGTAVAVVSADRVLHTVTLGSRSLQPRRPVTVDTRFLVASVTKSMSAALVATYVDQGALAWDQPAVDVWSGFRAPTDELTRTLRVRDLLGMGTGIGAPPAIDFHQGEPISAQLLAGLVNLPVIDQPSRTFFYNNTVYAVGAYLPLLATGVAPADLTPAYVQAMQDRVFRPAGMTGAQIVSDPRGLFVDYATARLQLRRGQSVTGARVVSADNLAQCWAPGVGIPLALASGPDVVGYSYALGWFREELTDGSVVVHHGGNIDGFSCFASFLPQQDLGLVVMNNMDSSVFANPYLLDVLLNQVLGLNVGMPTKALAYSDANLDRLARLGDQAERLDVRAVTPFLGYYEEGYSLVREGQQLILRLGSREWPLERMPDGGYVIAVGPSVTTSVKLARDADGTPHLELEGLETVRRTTGLD
jgi:CubicO group peptidase (beta-lactamase class C family)